MLIMVLLFIGLMTNYISAADGPFTGKDRTKPKRKYYKLEYSLKTTKTKHVLSIILEPVGSYYFNGDGYPPVSLVLEPPKGVILDNTKLTVKGIKSNKSHTWKVGIKSDLKSFTIPGRLSLILCAKDICEMVNDDVEFIIVE